MSEQKPNGASASMNTELGRLVVEQNLATQEEIDRCLSLQQSGQQTLADVLVTEGVVTGKQLAQDQEPHRGEPQGHADPRLPAGGALGPGAMATVFKARQLSLDRTVAIKVLPKKLSENAEYVERFYKEGKAAAQAQPREHRAGVRRGRGQRLSLFRDGVRRGAHALRRDRRRKSLHRGRRAGRHHPDRPRWSTRTARGSSTATSSPRIS